MTAKEKVVATINECVDGDKTIAFGIVADISQEPVDATAFAIGVDKELANALANLFDEDTMGKILTKALSIRVKAKFHELAKKQKDEKGYSNLN